MNKIFQLIETILSILAILKIKDKQSNKSYKGTYGMLCYCDNKKNI